MCSSDLDVGRYLRMFTFHARAEIAAIEAEQARAPHERAAQRALARAMTTMLHGAAAAATVEEASRIVFDKKADPTAITDEVYETLAREMPCVTLAPGADVDVLAILEGAFAQSRSAGRKLLQQGAVTVNGEKLGATDVTVPAGRAVRGCWYLVRKGGRDVAIARAG